LTTKKTPKVTILVLNYNGKHLLNECITSLRKTTYPNIEVIIIDNGSTDGSTKYLATLFPWVKIIPLDKNYGFCLAYNIASQLVKSEFLLFLNNDVTIGNSDWLDYMVNVILNSPAVGAVGAKQLIATQKEIVENVGGSLLRWQGGKRIGFGEKDQHQYDKAVLEPFYISGSALLIKRELFVQAGGFDSEMFAYAEDLDLCWRLRLMGYKMKSCYESVIFHKSSSSFKNSFKSLYLSNRNFTRASIKNYSTINLLKHLPLLLMISGFFGVSAMMLTKNRAFLLSILKSTFHNIWNLGSTVKERQIVQHKRKVDDTEVFAGVEVGNIESISIITQKLEVFR
jgi:GT2 family glycosyltransferase